MKTYGLFPGDWYEGANLGHLYELRFEAVPDDAAKQRIADAYERALASGPAEPATEPWYWSGPWALLIVGQRRDAATGRSSKPFGTFDAMYELFAALDRVAPLAEVIFWGARELPDYEIANVADDPPSNGPEYPKHAAINDDLFHRDRDPGLPRGAIDDAFEQARRNARRAAGEA